MDDPSESIIDQAEAIANDESEQATIRKLAALIRELASDVERWNQEHASVELELEDRTGAIERDIQRRHDDVVRSVESQGYDMDRLNERVSEIDALTIECGGSKVAE